MIFASYRRHKHPRRKLSQESYFAKRPTRRRVNRHSAAASRVRSNPFGITKKRDRRRTKHFSHERLSATPSPSSNRRSLRARRRRFSRSPSTPSQKHTPSLSPHRPSRKPTHNQQQLVNSFQSVSPHRSQVLDHLLDWHWSRRESNHTFPPLNSLRCSSPAPGIGGDPDKYHVSPKPPLTEPTKPLLNQEGSNLCGLGSERYKGILNQSRGSASGFFLRESRLEKTAKTREYSDFANGTLGRNLKSAATAVDLKNSTSSSSLNQTEECISYDGEHHYDFVSFGSEEPRLGTPEASQPDTPSVKSETRAVLSESSSDSWQSSLSDGLNPFKRVHCISSESERKELFDVFDFETLYTHSPS